MRESRSAKSSLPVYITSPLGESELKILYRILHQTWEGIAGDIGECSGKRTMPRSHVIEVTLDANYIETRSCWKIDPVEKDIVKRFRSLPFNEQTKIAKAAFPFDRYEC